MASSVAPAAGEGMVVEILYPEFGNQAGANGNEMYLRACLPAARFIETSYDAMPAFATQDVSIILMGGMSEFQQELVIKHLMPYRDALSARVDLGTPMFFCGNAPEVLGKKIVHPDGTEVDALGLLDVTVRQYTPRRFTGLFAGVFDSRMSFGAIKVAGFKAQFTLMEGDNAGCSFCDVRNGFGLNLESRLEGFRVGNLIATWLIGPVLPENPPLTRWLLEAAGARGTPLAFEDVAMRAYASRVSDAFTLGAEMA